jgi:Glu-tRNA(Gln) amidotransferase subunit E-like FAD-binding protein
MKLSLQEANNRLTVLSFIPLHSLSHSVRVKIVRAQVALEKIPQQIDSDIQEATKKLKPEGFDDNMRKYMAALVPTADNEKEAEEQRNMEGFAEFKEVYDQVNAEYMELYNKTVADTRLEVTVPEITDADIEELATVFPSGKYCCIKKGSERVYDLTATEVQKLRAKDKNDECSFISNDDVLKAFIANFVA